MRKRTLIEKKNADKILRNWWFAVLSCSVVVFFVLLVLKDWRVGLGGLFISLVASFWIIVIVGSMVNVDPFETETAYLNSITGTIQIGVPLSVIFIAMGFVLICWENLGLG